MCSLSRLLHESQAESSDAPAQVLWPLLLLLQRQERSDRDHEQLASIRTQDALQIRSQRIHLQEKSLKVKKHKKNVVIQF